ncbi:ATP synthase F1 subunit epsilon [Odoribacter sp. OttesenSCG-928-J03]|nr:ATP synthase F1 subunit epsilon [Odoribacter sp. OttesenSCG-928-J03]MDL2283311.1 ATP synthase F1 subunit epsilon [Odoribacter sp. OttesenSCG-928-G04]
MILRIISIEKIVFNGTVDLVTLPGIMGSFTVLNNHAPLITILEPGEIIFATGNEKKSVKIGGGMVEVRNNRVAVVLDPQAINS